MHWYVSLAATGLMRHCQDAAAGPMHLNVLHSSVVLNLYWSTILNHSWKCERFYVTTTIVVLWYKVDNPSHGKWYCKWTLCSGNFMILIIFRMQSGNDNTWSIKDTYISTSLNHKPNLQIIDIPDDIQIYCIKFTKIYDLSFVVK